MRFYGNRRKEIGGYIILLATIGLAWLTRKQPRYRSRHPYDDDPPAGSALSGQRAAGGARVYNEGSRTGPAPPARRLEVAPVDRYRNRRRGLAILLPLLLLIPALICGLALASQRLFPGNNLANLVPSVGVASQSAQNNAISLEQVTTPQDAWIRLYRVGPNGAPDLTAPVGDTRVEAGSYSNVAIPLQQPVEAGTQLAAVLHQDSGTSGTFEPQTDTPLATNGQAVASTFALQVAAGAATNTTGAGQAGASGTGAASASASSSSGPEASTASASSSSSAAASNSATRSSAAASTAPGANADSSTAPGINAGSPPLNVAAGAAALALAQQPSTGNSVQLDTVVAPEDGWVAVYRRNPDGTPNYTEILGTQVVQAGQNANVRVPLNENVSPDDVVAVLHADRGTRGTFEYPTGPDAPVAVNDALVAASPGLNNAGTSPAAAASGVAAVVPPASTDTNVGVAATPNTSASALATDGPIASSGALGAVATAAPSSAAGPSAGATSAATQPSSDLLADSQTPISVAAGTAALALAQQPVAGNALQFDTVTAPEDGFVAAYRRNPDGTPNYEQLLGTAPVQQGQNNNVTVSLNGVTPSDDVVAVLHADRGTPGTFEYPADAPLSIDGALVAASTGLAAGASSAATASGIASPDLSPSGSATATAPAPDGVATTPANSATENATPTAENVPDSTASAAPDAPATSAAVDAAPTVAAPATSEADVARTATGATAPTDATSATEATATVQPPALPDATSAPTQTPAAPLDVTAGAAALELAPQPLADDSLQLDNVTAPEEGFVAVYRRNPDGTPDYSQPLGSSPVQQGQNTNVAVPLNEVVLPDDVVAVLHADRGTPGTLEYPNGPDAPVAVDGNTVTADTTSPGGGESSPAIAQASATPNTTASPPSGTDVAATAPGVRVSNPGIVGNTVTLEQVTTPEDGWVVLYRADQAGNPVPDQIVGTAPVQAGSNANVQVPLTSQLPDGERVVALLHQDRGARGTLEYPNGSDTPLTSDYERAQLVIGAAGPNQLPDTGATALSWAAVLLAGISLGTLGMVLRQRPKTS